MNMKIRVVIPAGIQRTFAKAYLENDGWEYVDYNIYGDMIMEKEI